MNMITQMFWNRDEGRLPAGWRVLLLLIATAVAHWAVYGRLGQWVDWPHLFVRLTYLFVAACALALAVRFLDRRRWSDLGFKAGFAWWRSVGVGVGLAFAVIATVFVVQWSLGWIRIVGFGDAFSASFWAQIAGLAALFTAIGLYEEALCRGYLLRNLAEGATGRFIGPRLGLVIGWALSSFLFALMHAGNPNVTAIGKANILLIGAVFGLPYLLTRSMAVPAGLHIGWNFSVGAVFGWPVSGGATKQALIQVEQGGPTTWAGGAFGPEGGLLITLATLVLALGLVLLARRETADRETFFDLSIATYRRVPARSEGAEARAVEVPLDRRLLREI